MLVHKKNIQKLKTIANGLPPQIDQEDYEIILEVYHTLGDILIANADWDEDEDRSDES